MSATLTLFDPTASRGVADDAAVRPAFRGLKGAVVGFQWALRMHGFDENAPGEISPG